MFKILPIFFLRSGIFNCLFRYFTGYTLLFSVSDRAAKTIEIWQNTSQNKKKISNPTIPTYSSIINVKTLFFDTYSRINVLNLTVNLF